ncbi:restriction endonuclease [Clostridium rectalis]|uniref:restriction endonuclease n=1 Tax=Clostridium rectalis TaxID=2040295 RepID=UPI000F638317|nr:restriction endonuclease [Clostridium rectalis]
MKKRTKFYKSNYNLLNIIKLSKFEKNFFKFTIRFFEMIRYICMEMYKGIKYLPILIRNFNISYNNGYNLNELISKLNYLTPRQFEVMMAEVFKYQGYYDVKLTKFTHDYGRDIILKRKVNGVIETTYVECKYYDKNSCIGRDICFKLLGSMQMFNADKGIICSTGKFNKNSIEVARSVKNLELMNENDIKFLLFKLKSNEIQRVMFKVNNVS